MGGRQLAVVLIIGACVPPAARAGQPAPDPPGQAARTDVAVGFTMQAPPDVNLPPRCEALSLPCGTPRTFPDFGLALSAAAHVDGRVAVVGEASVFDNTWYSSLTRSGKESNVVRQLTAGVRFTVVPPAVGGGRARGVRLFGQVLAGSEWSTVQSARPVVQPGGGIDAKLSNGPTIRIELDYDAVQGEGRNLSGTRVFVGLVHGVGALAR